jgi:cell division protein FtsW
MPAPLRPDKFLAVVVAVLVLLGILMVWSASAIMTLMNKGDSYYYLWRHLTLAGIGTIALLTGYMVDYTRYQRWAFKLFLLTIVFLVLVLLPWFGRSTAGVDRWFQFGPINFQPSELAKLTAVMFLSASITVSGPRLRDFGGGLLPNLIFIGLACLLIIIEPDLGSTICIFTISMIFLYLGGARLKHLMGVLAGGGVVLLISLYLKPYQLERISIFLDPEKDPGGKGFQIIQSMVALGHGGLNGLGFGDGWQKLFFLPAAHTDFVLAVIGEEMGFMGILFVAILFSLVAWRGFGISLGAPDTFGRYLALGLTITIVFQAMINAGVVLGLLPTKGLTMPFLSYGGSSLAVNLFAVGILLNISQYRRA